ncbi:MAG: ribokinase [Desulfosarcinaceae bacterium]|nr:ribokinase [Desulfosarcinaceae bacterium]
MGAKIVVVGSINVDLVIHSDRLPLPGETLKGGPFRMISGGKGANQAVAAARQGVPTALVGCVGDDSFGQQQSQHLAGEKIDIHHISEVENESTGVALIVVEPDGENRIILAPAANDALTPEMIASARDTIIDADILICQLETPLATVGKAMEIAKAHQTTTILNPAPAMPLDSELLRFVDYLVPNETEAERLSGVAVTDVETAKQAAAALAKVCPGVILITMGETGVLSCTGGRMEFTPAVRVKAVDTTAAGDTFIGTLAAFLIQKDPLDAAVRKAMSAAAISVTQVGAQTSIPRREAVLAFYKTLNQSRDR